MTRSAPLSFGQELFWQLDRATAGLVAYNVPRGFRIRGALDEQALAGALDDLIERHDVLRSVFSLDGDHPVQTTVDGARVPFERVDLSGHSLADRTAELSRALDARAAYHFDLAHDVLLRATLFRLAADEHVLFVLTHHIVSDGWSKSITFRDLSALYAARVSHRAAVLPPLSMRFGDYARQQRSELEGAELTSRLAYWREQLRGPLPELDLPTDRPRPIGHTFEGDVRETLLPTSLVDRMKRLGQAHGASLYMVLLAAYQTLLHRHTGQDDIIVGSPTAGRDDEATQELIGYFAGALVLRTSFTGDPSLAALLDRVANTSLDAYEHQDVPFETLVLELQKDAQLTHAPLFRCVLTMEDTIPAELRLGDTIIEAVDVSVPATKFDLTLLFSEQPGGLRLRLFFRTALFDGSRIELMLGHLRTLLEAGVSDPTRLVSTLPLLTPAEARALRLGHDDAMIASLDGASILERVASWARLRPDTTAVTDGITSISYAELDRGANQLGNRLAGMGVASGGRVGICLERSPSAILALLGVMRSGAAYVPLAPDLPADRLDVQIRNADIRVVVTDSAYLDRLAGRGVDALALDRDDAAIASEPVTAPAVAMSADTLAYVLFTSGSTGVPKGVAVTHGNLASYASAIIARFGWLVDTPRQFALVSTFSADLGNTTLFGALSVGATLHVLPGNVATDPTRFAEYMSQHELDVLKITPSHLRALLAGPLGDDVLPRRWLVLGGEALPWDLAERVTRSRCRVVNHYGPTETTVGCCVLELTTEAIVRARAAGARTVPIGNPLPNARAYVVDGHGQLVPAGVIGELWIGGAGVARGYVGDDRLTAARFIADPFTQSAGGRLFRTGDRVRLLSDGNIEFLGRMDRQVKVRGFRVEPGEVEEQLRTHVGVETAVVVPGADDAGDTRLVAYVVARKADMDPKDPASAVTLMAWLDGRLPSYMAPAAIVFIDELPLTPNGKLDVARLPSAETGASATPAPFVSPQTPTEIAVARIWCDVLKRERIGATESFLDLGGHSLLAIRMLGRISKDLGVRLPIRTLFEAPTIAQIAAVIDEAKASRDADAALRAALAAVEDLSDDEVSRQLVDGSSADAT